MNDHPTVTISGIEYVPKRKLDEAQDQADDYRRTLAFAHTTLCLDGPDRGREAAVNIIQKATGWTIHDAQAIRSITQAVLTETTPK